MGNFFSENKRMLISYFVIVIIFPIIVLAETPIGMIPREMGYTIIAYGGAILGGFLTLYGVWWTIEIGKNKEREDRALQYRPVLQYDICKTSTSHQQAGELNFIFDSEYFDNSDLCYLDSMIQLKNVGRGEIEQIDFIFKVGHLIHSDLQVEDSIYFLSNTYFLGNQYINFIPIDGMVYIHLGVPNIKKEYTDNVGKDFMMPMNVILDIQYKGLLSEKKYCQSLIFNLDIKYHNNKYTCKFFNTSLDLKILLEDGIIALKNPRKQ